jgi:superfamily II DNA or RNA helicase
MTPIIKVGNSTCRIECDRPILHMLDQQLSVEVPGAQFARMSRPGWDGRWHPLDINTGRFPTGLLNRVRKILPIHHVDDQRIRPHVIEFNENILDELTLADHQQEATLAALNEANGILGLSVGSGKTECGIAVACHVGGLCVWVTHKKDLFRQTYERILLRTGQRAALIGDGCWDEITNQKFAIVMPQTVQNDMDRFIDQVKEAKVLICDEAHRTGAASTWYRMTQTIPAYFRIGLTGTPFTGDDERDRRLEAATGPLLIRRKSSDMAKIGWVVPCKVIYHKVINAPLHGVEYRDARRILIEENPERNAMVVEFAMEAAKVGKRCLVICDTIRHVKIISEVLRGESVRSMVLTGKHSSMLRSQAKKDLKSGALEVMISTPIWDEGVDLPELEVVVIAAGGKSAPRFIQRCGRALRKAPGKTEATVHDFYDTGSRYTVRHSVARINACRNEGFEVAGDGVPRPIQIPRSLQGNDY